MLSSANGGWSAPSATSSMSTIVAAATAQGPGAIAIIRLSGPRAKSILARCFLPLAERFSNFRPWFMHHGRVLDEDGETLDDALAVFMPGPRTYTGEDMAEIHCHGGTWIVQTLLAQLCRMGARQAEKGEFSRRALLNGRMDLSQAEAVAELVAAPSREAVRYSINRLEGQLSQKILELRDEMDALRVQISLAVDFPDDEVQSFSANDFQRQVGVLMGKVGHLLAGKQRARMMQQGALVVLAGAVNAGKSSLLNALIGRERALVTSIPGTTRDFLEEACDLDGLPVRLVDTAGLRDVTPDGASASVEALGIARSREQLATADAILLVVDGAALGETGATATTCPESTAAEILEQVAGRPIIVVWNKSDLCYPDSFPPAWVGSRIPCIGVSAKTGDNVNELAVALKEALLSSCNSGEEVGLAPNARQALTLEEALDELQALYDDIGEGMPFDVCAVRLDTVATILGEVTGLTTPADVLDKVFGQFCIGK